MRQTISITIEHIVVASNWSYDQVKESLEAQLSGALNIDELVQPLAAVKASWEQVTQAIEKRLGTSGFSLFSKVDHGVLLSLAGKLRRVTILFGAKHTLRDRAACRGCSTEWPRR